MLKICLYSSSFRHLLKVPNNGARLASLGSRSITEGCSGEGPVSGHHQPGFTQKRASLGDLNVLRESGCRSQASLQVPVLYRASELKPCLVPRKGLDDLNYGQHCSVSSQPEPLGTLQPLPATSSLSWVKTGWGKAPRQARECVSQKGVKPSSTTSPYSCLQLDRQTKVKSISQVILKHTEHIYFFLKKLH